MKSTPQNQKQETNRQDLQNMSPETYTDLRDSYYHIGDGIAGLEFLRDSGDLKEAELEALKALREAYDKLDHLSAAGL